MFLPPVCLLSLQGRYRKTADFLKRLPNCADCVSTLSGDFDFDLGLVPERSASFLFSHSFVYLFIYSVFFFPPAMLNICLLPVNPQALSHCVPLSH